MWSRNCCADILTEICRHDNNPDPAVALDGLTSARIWTETRKGDLCVDIIDARRSNAVEPNEQRGQTSNFQREDADHIITTSWLFSFIHPDANLKKMPNRIISLV